VNRIVSGLLIEVCGVSVIAALSLKGHSFHFVSAELTISSSTVLRFSQACDSFQNGGTEHGCDGAHGVGWLFLCVCVGPLACRGIWFSAVKSTSISRQLWLCRLSAQHAFTWAQQAGCPSCLLRSERLSLVSASFRRPNHQYTTVPCCSSDTRHWDQSFTTSTF